MRWWSAAAVFTSKTASQPSTVRQAVVVFQKPFRQNVWIFNNASFCYHRLITYSKPGLTWACANVPSQKSKRLWIVWANAAKYTHVVCNKEMISCSAFQFLWTTPWMLKTVQYLLCLQFLIPLQLLQQVGDPHLPVSHTGCPFTSAVAAAAVCCPASVFRYSLFTMYKLVYRVFAYNCSQAKKSITKT